MALAARPQHDIIFRPSIPLAATTDQPLADTPRPPESASNDVADQAEGVAKEITPEQQAEAVAARRGDPKTGEMNEPEAKGEPKKAADPDPDEDDGLQPDEASPSWAKKQIAEIRKKARERVKSIREATQAEVGDEKWNAAWEAANSNVVQKYREDLEKAQADARRATAERVAFEKKVADLEAARNPPEETKPDPRPTRDEYDDPDQYDEALISWGEREADRKIVARQAEEKAVADKAEADRKVEEEAKAQEKQAQALAEENAKLAIDWEVKVAAAQEKYTDYEEVVMRPVEQGGPNISEAMAAAMTRTDNGPDVAYYLALNTEEAERIATLQNPILQMFEIAKLSGRLSAPASRQRQALPKPIRPIEASRNEPQQPNPDEEDMDSYFKRRTPQIMGERRPFFPPGGIH